MIYQLSLLLLACYALYTACEFFENLAGFRKDKKRREAEDARRAEELAKYYQHRADNKIGWRKDGRPLSHQ